MTTPEVKPMVAAQTTDAAFIFNFFLRPLKPDLQGAVEGWAKAGDRIANHHKDDGKYISTHLHMGVSEDSHFEIFNFAAFADFSAMPFLIATDIGAFFRIIGSSPAEMAKRPPMRAIPGGFNEIQGLTRFPDRQSLPKRRDTGNLFIVATYAFDADIPKGPPPPGSPPGPPGLRPATSDAITQARSDFEADWVAVSGAKILAGEKSINDVYLYRRETHGVATFVLKAECDMSGVAAAAAAVDGAKGVAAKLRQFCAESEFFKEAEMRVDVDVYKIIINGDSKSYEANDFGIV